MKFSEQLDHTFVLINFSLTMRILGAFLKGKRCNPRKGKNPGLYEVSSFTRIRYYHNRRFKELFLRKRSRRTIFLKPSKDVPYQALL